MRTISIWFLVIFFCMIRNTLCLRNSILQEVVKDERENEVFSKKRSRDAEEMQILDREAIADNDDDGDEDDDENDDDGDGYCRLRNVFYGLSRQYSRLRFNTDLVRRYVDEATCRISLPNHICARCRKLRQHDLAKQKKFYALSKPVANPVGNQIKMPLLDKSYNATLGYFMYDEFNAHWFNVYFILLLKTIKKKTVPSALKKFAGKDFTTYKEYFQVSDFFKKSLQSLRSPYIKFPSSDYKYFTNIRNSNKFLKDKYFVEQRFVGLNPMTIRRVTLKGKIGTNWSNLKARLNPTFKWGKAISKITRRKLLNSIKNNFVYVVEFPILSGLPVMPDVLHGKTKFNATMRIDTNPIAIFATQKNAKGRYEMKVVAIQIDEKPAAAVYTPSDGYLWDLAKAQVQASDALVGNFEEHLLKTHFRMEPLCVGVYRHLSKLHPLHEILKFHCRGLIPLNKNGLVALLNYTQGAHVLMSVGNHGAAVLMNKAIIKAKWDDINIHKNIKERGMDDRRKVPFYPYRDDGKVLDQVLRKFSWKFVRTFYKRHSDVVEDYELQNFVNELSANGKKPPYNGLGQMKGLKGSFKTKSDVANFLRATLWITVQHSAVNLPIVEYGKTPYWPTKIYNDQRAKQMNNFVYMLPGWLTSVLQSQLSYSLASLHYDSLFDYSKKVSNPKIQRLVEEAYIELMLKVKPMLDLRNARRMKNGHLTNPFMLPDWITNGVSS